MYGRSDKEVNQQEPCCPKMLVFSYPLQSSYFNNVANIGAVCHIVLAFAKK
jgi:hypothetical protein